MTSVEEHSDGSPWKGGNKIGSPTLNAEGLIGATESDAVTEYQKFKKIRKKTRYGWSIQYDGT